MTAPTPMRRGDYEECVVLMLIIFERFGFQRLLTSVPTIAPLLHGYLCGYSSGVEPEVPCLTSSSQIAGVVRETASEAITTKIKAPEIRVEQKSVISGETIDTITLEFAIILFNKGISGALLYKTLSHLRTLVTEMIRWNFGCENIDDLEASPANFFQNSKWAEFNDLWGMPGDDARHEIFI
jgi:hypothetical protein